MTYYLSVDGGGTSTTLLTADESGRELARVTVASTSFKAVGNEAARAHIREGLAALKAAGFPAAGAEAGIWGLSGCDSPADRAAYRAILEEAGLSAHRHHVCNDALLALHAAASAPAVAVISGTGSIAYAVTSDGRTRRAGGWNYAFSDLGAGYWIGARLLEAFALWTDGIPVGESGEDGEDPAFETIRAALALPTAAEAALLRQRLEAFTSAGGFATLAFTVLSAPETSVSPLCHGIINRAAAYLADYAAVLLGWLGAEDPGRRPDVVLAGGMMKIPVLQDALRRCLEERGVDPAAIIHLSTDPVWGGIRMARERLFYEE